MFPKSIRWKLPLSYAGIALLTAAALGAVLLTTLRSHYVEREASYLRGNAEAISGVAAHLLSDNIRANALQARVESFSFLSQTRVQLLDRDKNILADSGVPQGNRALSLSFTRHVVPGMPPAEDNPAADYIWSMSGKMEAMPIAGTDPNFNIATCPSPTDATSQGACLEPRHEGEQLAPPFSGAVSGGDQPFVVSVAPSLYGFGLSAKLRFDNRRSDQSVEAPIRDNQEMVIGYVRLSDGPAYGLEIVDSVALGWVIASSIAVLLAAGAGWLISRHMSAPLLNLTLVTARMASGDLSARANIPQKDEFGALAHAFNDMAAKVEETIVVLRRFVADAAHEIHTPLTALRTNLELALAEGATPTSNSFVERAQGQVRRLEMLTDGLLQLSRIETAATPEKLEPVNLVALVRELSEFYASQAEQAGLVFDLELPARPVVAHIHAAQFRSALSNLIDNAIKFTPENGVIKLGLCQERRVVQVWVRDSGIGIPAEDLALVFNRFHRGRNVSAYAGSGLGLAIVKAVIERHQGNVSVASGAGGTRFVLQLPAAVL